MNLMFKKIVRRQGLLVLFLAGLFGAPALETRAESDHPCSDDFQTLCKGIPWGKMTIIRCFEEKWDQLSDLCKANQEKHQELNELLMTACKTDMREHCEGVDPLPGSDPLAECLGDHITELSEECREAYILHEASKE